jgi:hypothetical protein
MFKHIPDIPVFNEWTIPQIYLFFWFGVVFGFVFSVGVGPQNSYYISMHEAVAIVYSPFPKKNIWKKSFLFLN